MSEREVNEDLDPAEKAFDGQVHEEDCAEERDGDQSDQEKPDSTTAHNLKVINKGKSRLIISDAGEAPKKVEESRTLAPEPRVAKAKAPLPVPDTEVESVAVQRLEREVDPGKERIKIDKVKFEELKERPDEAQIQEEQWGSGLTPGWWIAIAGACTAVVLLGGLALESWMDGDQAQIIPTPAPRVAVDVDPYEGNPEKWLHRRGEMNRKEINALLENFTINEDNTSRSEYVRSPAGYLEKVGQWKVKMNPRLVDTEEQSISISHTGDTAFVVLECKDTDFMPFRAYFVRDGERLKFDWEASSAWSEVSFNTIRKDLKAQQAVIKKIKDDKAEADVKFEQAKAAREKAIVALRDQKLRQARATLDIIHVVKSSETLASVAKRYQITADELMRFNQLQSNVISIGQKLKVPTKNIPENELAIVIPQEPKPVEPAVLPEELYTEPLLVRCILHRRDEFYAGPYNDREHSAFMLLSPDKSHYFWAYTARDSGLDIELRKLLDHGRFVVDLKKYMRVTLRIRRNKKDTLPSQVELVEIVHPEWVTP